MQAPPIEPELWSQVLKQDGEAVLTLSIRRPAFPEKGKTRRLEQYFGQMARRWRRRWESVLFPEACQALSDARAASRPFDPWRAELDYTVTLWRDPLLSLYLDAAETRGDQTPRPVRFGEVWDCSTGYPRTLRSFFPPKDLRWRRRALDAMRAEAARRLSSGESLLDPDCARILERVFDPDRFYLTEEGAAVFFPLCTLGPRAEGIPVFSVPLSETAFPPGSEAPAGGSAQNPG